jgi:hypothetical protein
MIDDNAYGKLIVRNQSLDNQRSSASAVANVLTINTCRFVAYFSSLRCVAWSRISECISVGPLRENRERFSKANFGYDPPFTFPPSP